MREHTDADRLKQFMRALGAEAERDTACYLTGGATAVAFGWRPTTLDVDIKLVPESDRLLRAIPRLKDDLRINVELASPGDFIPLPDGWEGRSLYAGREGRVTFYHFDPYAQALAKLERSHEQDLEDVRSFVESGLVEPERALAMFDEIEAELYRFPAVDPPSFRRSVESAFGGR